MAANSEKASSNKPDAIQEADEIYEDEISLMDYFFVLWKHKLFIMFGTILPLLIAVTILFIQPKEYTITYTYDIKDQALTQKDYALLVSNFQSDGNLNRIVTQMKDTGLSDSTFKNEWIKKLVKFEALPKYIDLSSTKVTDSDKLEQISQMTAQLLNVTIMSNSAMNVQKMASIIKDNFENVIPLYVMAEQRNIFAKQVRSKMSAIESDKFSLQLDLGKNIGILSKLKKINTETAVEYKSQIFLQFNADANNFEYLPIEYQIQNAPARIINIEETISSNEKLLSYYGDLLSLNEKFLTELKNKTKPDYTVEKFNLFLLGSAKGAEKQEIKDYLNSYIKEIENSIAASSPIIESPNITTVSKNTVKISGVIFATSLMISIFGAFLREGVKNYKNKTF